MTISGPDANNWLAGHRPGGAAFGVSDPVVIEAGPWAGQPATVVTLAELEPEPVYLVETSAGHYTQIAQSRLRRRDH
jgi:hypothetical protein